MAAKTVRVGIWHGDELYMSNTTENDIEHENIPSTARLLMDGLYLRLDDQVSAAQLRTHRRRLRDEHRTRAVGKVDTGSEKEGGREIAQ